MGRAVGAHQYGYQNQRLSKMPRLISHFNLFRSVELNGGAKPGYSTSQANDALREVAAKVLPAGYAYDFGGLSREEINAGSSSIYIFMLIDWLRVPVSGGPV